MQEERRQDYRPILPGTEVVYRMAAVQPIERRYFLGIAENVSFGGLFLAARRPFPVGTLVWLDLYPGGKGGPRSFSARAVVRWRRVWQEPRGMGLQFLEITDLAARSVASVLDDALAPLPAARQTVPDRVCA